MPVNADYRICPIIHFGTGNVRLCNSRQWKPDRERTGGREWLRTGTQVRK